MADVAQDHVTQPNATWSPRPDLQVVTNEQASTLTSDSSDTTPAAAEPNVWRSAMTGVAIGFFAATIVVTIVGILSGVDPGSAFGLGVFVGIWSGCGFGFMWGGTIAFARQLDAEHAARSIGHGQGGNQ